MTSEIKQQVSAIRSTLDLDRYVQALWGPAAAESDWSEFAESFRVEFEPVSGDRTPAGVLPWD